MMLQTSPLWRQLWLATVFGSLFVWENTNWYGYHNNMQSIYCHALFNEEVVERVMEQLDSFLSRPKEIIDFELAFRKTGGFPHDLGPADRDTYFAMSYALFGQPNTFVALEDGTFMGMASGGAYAFFKEHGITASTTSANSSATTTTTTKYGNTLYKAPTTPDDPNWKYWISCVNSETGQPENCETGTSSHFSTNALHYYVECIDDCKLAPCPDPDSQRNCSAILVHDNDNATAAAATSSTTTNKKETLMVKETARRECLAKIKYCPQYNIREANFTALAQEENKTYGFVPRWYHCIDELGRVTQDPGTCFFADGETPVIRNITSDYAYCQGKATTGGGKEVCNPLVGNYRSAFYDARYRPFYTIIRDSQKTRWAKPDPSFHSFEVSYSAPMYSTDEQGRQVFDGVMAMDYDLRDITQFLSRAYNHTEIAVALFEQEEPHYIIASSTGTPPMRTVLNDDPNISCPYDETSTEGDEFCHPVRLPMTNYSIKTNATPADNIIHQAFVKLQEAGFPRQELFTLNVNDDLSQENFYVTTIGMYETPDEGLAWSFVVVMPGQSSADGLMPGQPGFAIVCGVASVGAAICFLFLVAFLMYRKKPAIMMADWRFTCLFFAGCVCLNLASFTFLGKNTNVTCLVRMWAFRMAFVVTISPLLAKCYRMRLLVSAPGTVARRRKITHFQTFLLMLPPIIFQALLLLIFTFVDPPIPTQVLENPGMVDVTQHVICSANTQVFFIIQIVFEGSLTIAGAILAYQLRDVESQFGETKQLLFAMSSILGVGAILLIFSALMGHDDNGKKVLYAVGSFWGTAVCCCAFALPRLLHVQSAATSSTRHSGTTTEILRSSNFRTPEPNSSVSQSASVSQSGCPSFNHMTS